MPPKGKKKAKAKGKAKARVVVVEEGAEGTEGAIVPVAKPKSLAGKLKRQIKDALVLRSYTEVFNEHKEKLTGMDASIEEAQALESAHEAQVQAAQKELDAARKEVEEAMQGEVAAMQNFKAMGDKKRDAEKKIQLERANLMEQQKKLNMINVMAVAFKSRQMAEEAKQRAAQAAAQAKEALMAQREREKAALEATRKALSEARGKRLAAAAGVVNPEPSKKAKSAAEADTLVEGEDIE